MKYLSTQKVVDLLEVVLDRLYTLRNQLVHGGATYKSEVNRSQVIDGKNILSMLVPFDY
jgi:Zn-dependent oligopeptidase